MSGNTNSPMTLAPPRVQRLNYVPLIGGGVVCLTVMAVIVYTMVQKSNQNQVQIQQQADSVKAQSSTPPKFLNQTTVTPDTASQPPPDTRSQQPPPSSTQQQQQQAAQPPPDLAEKARAQAWQAYYQKMAQLADERSVKLAQHASMDPLADAGGNSTAIPDMSGGGLPVSTDGNPNTTGGVNPAGQTGKQNFLKSPGDPFGLDENVPGSVHGPKPLTIMEGTALPCVTVEGATSDLPGQLNGEINVNVYDSMTGDHLLIPAHTKVITTYDIAVSTGQNRMGVIGQRLVFPDTSSRQLGSMSLADPSGLAGLADQLDTHFWEKFGVALTVSLVGAGAQLAQPQASAFTTPTSTSQATGAMTQQMSQFGQEQARANSYIANTIRLRAGLECMVKLNHDLTLPEWHDSRVQMVNDGRPIPLTIGKLVQ